MSYSSFYNGGWQSGEAGATPLSPEALNHMDKGIRDAHSAVDSGYGGTMPYLNGESGGFLTLLQELYSTMGDRTSCQMVFSDSVLGGSIRWWGTVWRFTQTYGVVIARNTNGVLIQRGLSSGAWGAWEYENPPMAVGTEYRTVERWMGKPVYAMLVSIGDAAGEQSNTVPIMGLSKIVRTHVTCGELFADSSGADFAYSVSASSSGVSFHTNASDQMKGQPMHAVIYFTR
jgi:hypothetical protein